MTNKLNINFIVGGDFRPEQRQVIDSIWNNAQEVVRTKVAPVYQSYLENDCDTITIKFNDRLRTTGGQAQTNRLLNAGFITINREIFQTTGTIKDFDNVVRHELAHILANFAYKKNCGHGRLWRSLFVAMGGNGERCHSIDVNHLRRKTKQHAFSCDCKTHWVSSRKKNNILNKGAMYRCISCKGTLTQGAF